MPRFCGRNSPRRYLFVDVLTLTTLTTKTAQYAAAITEKSRRILARTDHSVPDGNMSPAGIRP